MSQPRSHRPPRWTRFAGAFRSIEDNELCLRLADCQLRCRFCDHGLLKDSGRRGILSALRQEHLWTSCGPWLPKSWVRQELAARLRALPPAVDGGALSPVTLGGFDVLEHDDFFGLADECRHAGRPLRIVSPGLRLAERAFAARLRDYEPQVVLTYLSRRPDRYEAMTGLPGTLMRVERALDHLLSLGIDVGVNVVVTADNQDELVEIVGYLLVDLGISVAVSLLQPSREHFAVDRQFARRLPSPAVVGREVARSAARYARPGRCISVWNLPPCQVEPSVIAAGGLVFCRAPADRPRTDPTAPGCDGCGYQPYCPLVSRYYQQQFPDIRYDPARIASVLPLLLRGPGGSP